MLVRLESQLFDHLCSRSLNHQSNHQSNHSANHLINPFVSLRDNHPSSHQGSLLIIHLLNHLPSQFKYLLSYQQPFRQYIPSRFLLRCPQNLREMLLRFHHRVTLAAVPSLLLLLNLLWSPLIFLQVFRPYYRAVNPQHILLFSRTTSPLIFRGSNRHFNLRFYQLYNQAFNLDAHQQLILLEDRVENLHHNHQKAPQLNHLNSQALALRPNRLGFLQSNLCGPPVINR